MIVKNLIERRKRGVGKDSTLQRVRAVAESPERQRFLKVALELVIK